MIEYLLHALIEILDVLLGLVGKSIAGRSSPDQVLTVRVEKINNESADLVVLCRGSRLSESSPAESSPAPTSSEAVV